MRVSTLAVPPHHQARHWQSVISDVYVPLEFRPAGRGGFQAELEVHRVDGLEVSTLRADPHAVVRAPEGTAADATHFVMLPRAGELVVEQDGRTAHLRPGDLASYDASRACVIASREPFDLTIVKVAAARFRRAGVPQPPRWASAVRIDRESPVGSLAAPYLLRLAELGREHERLGLGPTTVGLLASALAAVGSEPGTGRDVLRMRSEQLIQARLGDPSLDPSRMAAALHVSIRTLQTVFAEVGTSPARFLLAARLDRAAELLTGPDAAARTVTEVAHAVGITDTSQFSRSFKARHGCAPREFRLRESATRPALRSM